MITPASCNGLTGNRAPCPNAYQCARMLSAGSPMTDKQKNATACFLSLDAPVVKLMRRKS